MKSKLWTYAGMALAALAAIDQFLIGHATLLPPVAATIAQLLGTLLASFGPSVTRPA